jgi:hypothetical protein
MANWGQTQWGWNFPPLPGDPYYPSHGPPLGPDSVFTPYSRLQYAQRTPPAPGTWVPSEGYNTWSPPPPPPEDDHFPEAVYERERRRNIIETLEDVTDITPQGMADVRNGLLNRWEDVDPRSSPPLYPRYEYPNSPPPGYKSPPKKYKSPPGYAEGQLRWDTSTALHHDRHGSAPGLFLGGGSWKGSPILRPSSSHSVGQRFPYM